MRQTVALVILLLPMMAVGSQPPISRFQATRLLLGIKIDKDI